MSQTYKALISIRAFSGDAKKALKQSARQISEKCEILRTSSVYQITSTAQTPEHIHDLRSQGVFSGLCVVFKVQTELPAQKLLVELEKLEESHQGQVLQRELSINLLVYENETYLSPHMTLPHPYFHRRAEEIHLAAEVWGEYLHPLLNKSLIELSNHCSEPNWGEFYAQGKSLLDF